MSRFVDGLAFPTGSSADAARVAILAASAVAAVVGTLAGWLLLPATPTAGAATSVEEAQRSTTR